MHGSIMSWGMDFVPGADLLRIYLPAGRSRGQVLGFLPTPIDTIYWTFSVLELPPHNMKERLEEFVAFAGSIKLTFPINLSGLQFRIS
jgi:hypothetical protein